MASVRSKGRSKVGSQELGTPSQVVAKFPGRVTRRHEVTEIKAALAEEREACAHPGLRIGEHFFARRNLPRVSFFSSSSFPSCSNGAGRCCSTVIIMLRGPLLR
jgi:hypothetical protein